MTLEEYITNGRLRIIAKPNAHKTEILDYDADKKLVRIAIAAPADKNKANTALLKFVSRQLKKNVAFVSGLKSKEKILEIN